MAQLLVRNIDSEIARELKLQAARNGRSAEEEHRQILQAALAKPASGPSLKQLLLQMPDLGEDEDFERPLDFGRPVEPWAS